MQWVKKINNIALRYIQNKEYELVYVVHRKSISLRDSSQSKKFVYSESRDSHNSLISSSKVCWVLYKSILLYNMFIGLFQSSLDISYLFIKYLTFSPIIYIYIVYFILTRYTIYIKKEVIKVKIMKT